ncbi:MAG: hypothetical protein AAGC44_04995 [Planctomycetota bacterium]
MEMPKNVRILGVLNIVLASVGIFFSLVGVAGIFLMKELSPDMGKVYTGAVLAASVALPMVGLITKAMMLFSGIGLVRGQAFGRSLGIIWAWSSMFYGVIAAAINSFFVSPAAMEASMNNSSSASGGAAAPPPGLMQMIQTSSMVMGMVMGLAMALGYQITFLVLMNRDEVKLFFTARQGTVS